MEILSISIDKEALAQLNAIQKKLGFKSRSKMLRSAVFNMLKDYEALDSLKGEVESVFVLTYRESEKNHVSDNLHKFEEFIKTELHQHNKGVCIDILSVHTDAENTRRMFGVLKKNKCISSVTCSVIGSARS